MRLRLPDPGFPGRGNRRTLRRTFILMALLGIGAFLPLTGKLVKLQVVDHGELSRRAVQNQTRESAITAARGTIYDRNMHILAFSADVENVCIDPNEIYLSGQDREKLAADLSGLLDVDPERTRSLMENTAYRYQIVKRKVEEAEAAKVREYISETGATGVYLEPDTRRYYPENTLAAQVLGFVGNDNHGLDGLEAAWDSTLTGQAGSIVTAKGNYGSEMPFHHETYYDATDGNSLVLTLDATVQQMLESRLQEAVERYDVQNGAFGLVMDADTGDILAMATLGSYDPNRYAEVYDETLRQELEELYARAEQAPEGEREALRSEYNDAVADARLRQWRNRVVADGYEPGSTFKIITLASALEEGAVTLEGGFYCSGATAILGRSRPLHCWKSAGHGQQTTAQALQNSCNVAFARIGIALGGEKLYEYVQKFGLTEKTGVELYGEASGIFFDEKTLSNPDSQASLASAAFGQTFKITPLQLVRAVAAVVNGGYLLEPHLVHQVLDPAGEVIRTRDRKVLRQVISQETSRTMCAMLESVVAEGTAKNARIAGYRIGGKTGTSEKIDVFDENGNMVEDKIVSFVGIAPMEDPRYVVLAALDTPSRETGLYISGGQMAAPTVRNILSDILPYLGIEPEQAAAEVPVPDLLGKSREAAEQLLRDKGLSARFLGTEDTVTAQIPGPGGRIPGGSEIILRLGGETETGLVTVPDVSGLDRETAGERLLSAGLYMKTIGAAGEDGTITAVHQTPEPGALVPTGSTVTVELSDLTARD